MDQQASESKLSSQQIFDLHIVALETLDKELNRLHETLARNNNGDDDVTQEQITVIIEELCRLSKQLGTAEAALVGQNGQG
jgi:hypothetical protein